MLRLVSSFLVVLLLASPIYAAESAPKKQKAVDVLFLELRAVAGTDPSRAFLIENVVLAALSKYKRFNVISKSDIANMLDAENLKEAMECDQASCMAEIAGALGTELIVAGTLGDLGENSSLLSLQLVSNLEGRVLARVSRNLSGAGAPLITQTQAGVVELVSDYDPSFQLDQELARVNAVGELEESDSMWSSWWLWTGLAVVAGGVATGVMLSGGEPGPLGSIQGDVEVGP